MPLTAAEMEEMIETLQRLCIEAQQLQERLKKAMAEQARADYPYRPDPEKRR